MKIVLDGVQQPKDMEIEHDTVTQELTSFNLVYEAATLELKE